MPRNFSQETQRLEELRLRLSKLVTDLTALECPSSLPTRDNHLQLSTIQDIKKFQLLLDSILLKEDSNMISFYTFINFLKELIYSLKNRVQNISWAEKKREVEDLLLETLKVEKKMQQVYKEFRIQDVQVELALVLLFGVFLFLHFQGRSKNKKIAQEFLNKLEKLKGEFSQIGDGFGHELIFNSPNEFFIYGTGRENVQKMFATVKTSPRQDFTKIGRQIGDKVTFEFTLTSNNSFIFAFFPKRNLSKKLKRWDLEKMTTCLSFSGFRKDVYTIMGDNSQVISTLLCNEDIKSALYVFSGLSSSGDGITKNQLLEEMICSDSSPVKPSKVQDLKREMILSFTFKLSQDQEEVDKMVAFMFCVVDSLADITLTKDTVSKIEKTRIMAEQSLMKASQDEIQQNLYKKKILEKKAREEARLKLSPEEARKAEEKEKRREMKKNAAKMRKKGKIMVR